MTTVQLHVADLLLYKWSNGRTVLVLNAGILVYARALTNDLEQLYKAEEFLVEGHWRDERRLNMIPGGKSGLRYLRENGFLKKNFLPEPDKRIKIIKDWLIMHPDQELPVPWLSEKWQDNDWAIAQICSRNDRLSIEQVRAIRSLAETHFIDEIAFRINKNC